MKELVEGACPTCGIPIYYDRDHLASHLPVCTDCWHEFINRPIDHALFTGRPSPSGPDPVVDHVARTFLSSADRIAFSTYVGMPNFLSGGLA